MTSVNMATIKLKGIEQPFILTERGEDNRFNTGSMGFHAQGKMTTTDGKRYQVNILLVEIGSKKK